MTKRSKEKSQVYCTCYKLSKLRREQGSEDGVICIIDRRETIGHQRQNIIMVKSATAGVYDNHRC